MKGDPVKPEAYVRGQCFLCRKTEGMEPDAYLHKQCADASWDEKERRKAIAYEKSLEKIELEKQKWAKSST